MYHLFSIFIGFLIALMALFNGTLSDALGNYTATVVIHGLGLFCMILLLLAKKVSFQHLKGIPLYFYSAGAIGVFTVLFNNLGVANLGLSTTIALGLLGQSITSIVIDHFGLLGMRVCQYDSRKCVGLLLIFLGIWCMSQF